VLEAAGLSFDHAWLAGFDAVRWPPASSPNPFLALGWQRARGIVGAHAEATLAHARALTTSLAGIAAEIVVSHADTIDDAPSSTSPLFERWPRVPIESLPGFERISSRMPSAPLERVVDECAPPLAAGVPVRGGAQLFESQSACPFQAFARFRLGAEAWDECPEGLSAKERGIVLHGMLNAFWNDVRDHATLLALDPPALGACIAAAVVEGKEQLPAVRWQTLPPAVAAAETRRLAATLSAWVDDGERIRPPFRVRRHEQALACDVGGIAVRVRIDRVDELGSGGLAVADYKSGRVIRPVRWFGERPEGVQLAVYAQAIDRVDDQALRALAYAQLKAGEITVSGIADADGLWPGLDVAGTSPRVPAASWDDARAQMREGLEKLAREVREGVASVSPRNGAACQYCDLGPLCRIRWLDDRGDAAATESSDG
jgi:ATP-dependent helicase/nuclease subunit B